jgi:hypothetical protein
VRQDWITVLRASFDAQLREPLPGEQNHLTRTREARLDIARIPETDAPARAAAAAAYGGCIKRWRQFLVEEISDAVLRGHDTSRGNVRDWQKETFGRSVDNGRLSAFATPERAGSAEPVRLAVSARTAELAWDLYEKYANALKERIELEVPNLRRRAPGGTFDL